MTSITSMDEIPPIDLVGETKFGRILTEAYKQKDFSKLSIVLGEKTSGEPFYFDLENFPHLLVAGASCMGKSVLLNTIICSFLMKFRPKDLNFLLIDPKQIEFHMYEPLPHLVQPVAKGIDGGIDALKWCTNEMERRYEILQAMRAKTLHSIPLDERPFPILVVVIDELAELILSGKEDKMISKLAGKARAAGIHLILATQRPSAYLISDVIRNIPVRIAMKASAVESQIILDSIGAEALANKGEMLVRLPGCSDIVKVQGAFVDDKHIKTLVEWWKGRVMVWE